MHSLASRKVSSLRVAILTNVLLSNHVDKKCTSVTRQAPALRIHGSQKNKERLMLSRMTHKPFHA